MEKEPPTALPLLGLESSVCARQPEEKQTAKNATIWKPQPSLCGPVEKDFPGLEISLGPRESSSMALNLKQITEDGDNSEHRLPFSEGKQDREHPRGQALLDRPGFAGQGDLSSLRRCKEEPAETQHLQRGMQSPWSTIHDKGSLLSLGTHVNTSTEEEWNLGSNVSPAVSSLQHASPMNMEGTSGFKTPKRTASPLPQNGRVVRYKTMPENRGSLPAYSCRSAKSLSGGEPEATSSRLRKPHTELDVSFQRANGQNVAMFVSNQTAFGSPFYSLGANPNSGGDNQLPMAAELTDHGFRFQAQPSDAKRSTAFVGKQPTAQMTVFYSGMVNVYDSVPADMANAIMLLAGSGNSWSSNRFMSAPRTESGSVPPSIASDDTGTATAVTYKKPMGLLTSSTTVVTSTAYDLKQPAAKRPGPELPYKWKASLGRFFEKRRDRVMQTKLLESAIDKSREAEDFTLTTPETLKRRCSRSPSPSGPNSRP